MGKGSNTTSTTQSGTSTASPDSNAYQAYLALLNRASGVASTPYQGFQGQETAPINEQQQAGIGNINQISGPNSQFIGQIDASGNPISAADIQRYQDPYTNQVINATQADFDVQNQRANSTVTGNAAAQGALGGDRVGVAQALTQEGQARVQAPVIAGLRSQGYQQAVNTAENQQQQALRAGVSAQSAAMQGAQAQVGAGTLEQQTQQAQDTQARQDYYQQQGYPFQVAQWLASMDTSVGGSMGGTSTSSGNSTTQGPTPNPWTQIAGLGLAGASMFIPGAQAFAPALAGAALKSADGGRITFAEGGGVHDDYNTMLSPDQEEAFQAWKAHNAANDSGADYDLRGAYLANMQRDPENGHMGDRFKKPNHPTFSDQSQYATGDQRDRAGFWVGPEGPDQTFVPPVATRRHGGHVMLRAGFASGGSPYGGMGPSWVPAMDPRASPVNVRATMPSAPQAPKQAGLSQDQMKGIGSLAKAGSGLFDSASYGGGNFLTDSYGGSSSSPLEGLSASDYGAGYHSGGRIRRYATGGFADGGMPDFSDRFDAAYPNMAAGVGASKPAYEPQGPTYDDGGGPFRLSAPEDLEDWRARVDRDNGRKITAAASDAGLPPPQLAAAPDDVGLPPEVTAGVSSKPRMTASAAPPEGAEDDTEALGYAGSPRLKAGVGAPQNLTATEQEKPGGILDSLGIKMTPELRQGLMQAGLAMMATTRGGPGSFLGGLGEAGMAGVGAYSKSVEAQQKHDLEQAKMAMEEEHFQRPYKEMTVAEKAANSRADRPYQEMTAAQKAADERQREARIPFGWKEEDDGKITPLPGGPADPTYMKSAAEARAKVPFGWKQQEDGSIIPIPGGPADTAYIKEKTEATNKEKWVSSGWLTAADGSLHPISQEQGTGKLKDNITGKEPLSSDKITPKGAPKGPSLSDYDAQAIARYTVATGDDSRLRSLGFNPENKALVQKYVNQEMTDKNVSDQDMATRKQEFSANGISKNAAARTRATREENLNMILKATSAAIPAALEESEKVARYAGAIVPLNRLIQHGELATSDEHLVPFAMANLQLAEHWARAMNPMGVMRESDRDLALKYLDTALSKGTYKIAIMQLKKQVTRERDSIAEGKPGQADKGNVLPGDTGEGGTATTKPTLQEFLTKAKTANPNSSDKDLTDYYNKKYGG